MNPVYKNHIVDGKNIRATLVEPLDLTYNDLNILFAQKIEYMGKTNYPHSLEPNEKEEIIVLGNEKQLNIPLIFGFQFCNNNI